MKKNLFPAILISVLLALWGLVLFGYNYSQAAVINKSNSSNALKNSLVGWWTFDGPDVTVNTTTDKSGYGNHATRNGGIKTVLGKIGQSIFFDGAGDDDVLTYPTPTFNTSTISFWFKTNTTSLPNGHRMAISGSANASGATYISLSTICGTICPFVSYRIGLAQQTLSSLVPSKVNTWTHIVVTWDGRFIRIFTNGVIDNTSADLSGSALVGFDGNGSYFGKYAAANGYEFSGSLDDIRMYSRALSAAEVAQLYTMGGGKINKTDITRAKLRTGLVGQWTFDGADITANTTTDKSGNGNNGSRSATGTTSVIGKIGQAMRFSGDAGRDISIPSSASLNPTQALSVAAWVKTTDGAGILVNKDDGGSNRQFSLLSNTGMAFYVFQSGVTFTNTAVINVLDGKWHFVVGTVDVNSDGKARIYIDGVLRDTGSVAITSIATTTLAATIGDRPTNAFPLNGTMDDVRIYNRALSPAEIKELYAMGGVKISKTDTTRPDLKSGLVGHWTFDGQDMTAVTSTDRSGQGNNGTRTVIKPGTGKVGQGIIFDDTARMIKIPYSPTLNLGNTGTISFWLKPKPTIVPNDTYVFYGNAGEYSTGFGFFRTSDTQLGVYWLSAGPSLSFANAFTYNQWQLFTLTNLNGSLVLYKNGVSVATGSSGGNVTASLSTYIGGEDSSGWYANGSMDDVRIYNRVLSQAEIMQLYRMGK